MTICETPLPTVDAGGGVQGQFDSIDDAHDGPGPMRCELATMRLHYSTTVTGYRYVTMSEKRGLSAQNFNF